jgi:hypothetical protein
MSTQYLTRREELPFPPYDAAEMAQGLYGALAHFLAPLLMELDVCLEKRLVRTFLQVVAVILTFRDRVNGLLLSELGGYLDSPDKAPESNQRRRQTGERGMPVSSLKTALALFKKKRAFLMVSFSFLRKLSPSNL